MDAYIGGRSENNIKCIVMTIFGGRTEQLVIIAGFLPHHWLYEWFSQFHSCGTNSVLSRSHSVKDTQWKTATTLIHRKKFIDVIFPSVLWHCWLGNRKGIWPVRNKLGVGWLMVTNWLELCMTRLTAPVGATTSSILSSNKIQNGDVLVPVNPVPPGNGR